MSAEAVEILRANGIHAFRLEEGVRDWKQITDLGIENEIRNHFRNKRTRKGMECI